MVRTVIVKSSPTLTSMGLVGSDSSSSSAPGVGLSGRGVTVACGPIGVGNVFVLLHAGRVKAINKRIKNSFLTTISLVLSLRSNPLFDQACPLKKYLLFKGRLL